MSYIKQFNTVGVSRQNGDIKIRMANDIEWRTFMLTKEGHVDILLVDLGETMSKPEAVKRALALPEFAEHAEAQACFVKYLQAEGLIEKVKKPRGRPAPRGGCRRGRGARRACRSGTRRCRAAAPAWERPGKAGQCRGSGSSVRTSVRLRAT